MAHPSNSGPVALVTGGAGFTGRYVLGELKAAGYRVSGWGKGDLEGIRLQDVELTDRQAVLEAVAATRPNVVVHLAAVAFVAHERVDELYSVNVLGTRNLLEALASLEQRPRHVLLASSANVYGNAGGMIDESVTPQPQNDYAVSKLAMEHVARIWSERLPITIVRPFNYTGVGQSERFLIPKIVKHFQARRPVIRLGNTNVARDFSDVRVVAATYRRLLESNAIGETFNVCSSVPVKLAEILEAMQRLSGHRIEVEVDPALVRGNEVLNLYGSPRKLLDVVPDYKPRPIEETLRWMYESEPLELDTGSPVK